RARGWPGPRPPRVLLPSCPLDARVTPRGRRHLAGRGGVHPRALRVLLAAEAARGLRTRVAARHVDDASDSTRGAGGAAPGADGFRRFLGLGGDQLNRPERVSRKEKARLSAGLLVSRVLRPVFWACNASRCCAR